MQSAVKSEVNIETFIDVVGDSWAHRDVQIPENRVKETKQKIRRRVILITAKSGALVAKLADQTVPNVA